jgi:MoaA/NifB/PqqE/SkfB family radical SAM enzyme
MRTRHPDELTTAEGVRLLNAIRRFGYPQVVLTGGDPLKRPDLVPLIRHGSRLGLPLALTPAGTPMVTAALLRELRDAGLGRLIVALDGARAGAHDTPRGIQGSFDWTMRLLRDAHRLGIELQINTVVTTHARADIEVLYALLIELGVVHWSVCLQLPEAQRSKAWEWLREWTHEAPFVVEVMGQMAAAEAHTRVGSFGAPGHSRSRPEEAAGSRPAAGAEPVMIAGCVRGASSDAERLLIDHIGDIYPSGNRWAAAGNVRRDHVVEVYRARRAGDRHDVGGPDRRVLAG